MMTFKQIITAACLLIAAGNTNGQRLTTQTYQLGIGGTNILDTYLSQEKFSGVGVTFLATREWQKADSRWSTMMEHEANFASTDDRADKRTELQGDYTLLVGRYYSWQLNRLKLQAGGMTTLNAGVIYNLSNTNNPAQARFSLQLMPSATAAYDITLAGRTLRLRYEVQLPLAGLMFSPNYGQSYYEIFSLGNYDHNIVPTTIVATPNLRQQLSAEYPVNRNTNIRVGYLGHYQQASVNKLKSHIYDHRFMIGIVRRFSLTPTRP
jgi:hypothetical protein